MSASNSPDRAAAIGSTVTCELCGQAAESAHPLGWSAEHTPERTRWTCADCTRLNVRSIEAKLEPRWW